MIMKYRYILIGLFISSLFLKKCSSPIDSSPMVATPYVFDLPDYVPTPIIPEGKELTQERVALGRKLFYDPRLSRDSSVACASCHLQSEGFADHHPVSVGIEGRKGFRNSPTLTNIGYHPYFFREGGNKSLESQAFGPIEEPSEMDFSAAGIVERLKNDDYYKEMALKAFGREFDNFVLVRGLGAFQRTLISYNSAFDDFYYKKNNDALTPSQQRGLALFFSDRLQCSSCHQGFDFSTYEIVNNGAFETYEDKGLYRISFDSSDIGKFKILSLRNVALTYPYMHNGSYATLDEVVEHYNRGGYQHPNQDDRIKPLYLTEEEKADLINFMKSLTDYDFITNEEFGDL